MSCINSVSYSVLLNGHIHGYIKSECVIFQGDPLYTNLFTLLAEALVGVLNNFERLGKLHGISLAELNQSITYFFSDDNLLISQDTEDEASEIVHCLKMYGEASCQQINVNKSSITFGIKVYVLIPLILGGKSTQSQRIGNDQNLDKYVIRG